jgi:hypothetical protein
VELVGRWWNGIWGQLARRDIWLYSETVWHVHAREGDTGNSHELKWSYPDEGPARAMVDRLIRAPGPGEWRDLTEVSAPPERPATRGPPGDPAAEVRK